MRPVRQIAMMLEVHGRGCAELDASVDPRALKSVVSIETARQLGLRGRRGKVMLKLPASGCGYRELPVKVGDTGKAPIIIARDYLEAVGAEVRRNSVTCCRSK